MSVLSSPVIPMRDSSHYPRGTPFKAPPEKVSIPADNPVLDGAPPERAVPLPRDWRSTIDERSLRVWAVKLALTTVLAVAVLVAVGVTIAVRMLRQPLPVAAARPAALDTKPAPESPGGSDQSPTTPVVESPPHTARAPKKEPPSKGTPPPPREELLDAVGSLLGTHLHQGYLNIGLLADAQENDVYEAGDAKKVLSNVLALLDNVDQHIARLSKSSLDDEDRKKLAQATALAVLLRLQAKELAAYWDTPDKDKDVKKNHETKYLKAREQAWTGIKELLEIKE